MGFVARGTHDQVIHTVKLSDAARQQDRPILELITEATSFLHKDGIVILEKVVDT